MASACTDFGLISDSEAVIERCSSLCKEFGFTFFLWRTFESFLESPSECKLILASLSDFEGKDSAAAELAQGIRFTSKDAFLVCTVAGTMAKEAAQFSKKSGANLILLKDELMNTSKLEFTMLQVIRSSYLAVKTTDLKPNVELPFDLYHLMPQRKKFVRFSYAGDMMDEPRYDKCNEVGEVYIHRKHAEVLSKFIASQVDRSAAGLAKRCRAEYLALYSSFANLIFLLTDQSEHASSGDGKEHLENCQKLCQGLLSTLGEFGDAWQVINNSSIGEMGSTERSPTVAAYAGLFGLQSEMEGIDRVMLGALLCDLGLILLPPTIMAKIRADALDTLTEEERKVYQNYPNLSLDAVLGKKLSIDEKLRGVMLSTHERVDGKGFPKGSAGERVALGSQLIQYCRDFDRRTMLKLGRPRPDRSEVRKTMSAEDHALCQKYSAEFWKLMDSIL